MIKICLITSLLLRDSANVFLATLHTCSCGTALARISHKPLRIKRFFRPLAEFLLFLKIWSLSPPKTRHVTDVGIATGYV